MIYLLLTGIKCFLMVDKRWFLSVRVGDNHSSSTLVASTGRFIWMMRMRPTWVTFARPNNQNGSSKGIGNANLICNNKSSRNFSLSSLTSTTTTENSNKPPIAISAAGAVGNWSRNKEEPSALACSAKDKRNSKRPTETNKNKVERIDNQASSRSERKKKNSPQKKNKITEKWTLTLIEHKLITII